MKTTTDAIVALADATAAKIMVLETKIEAAASFAAAIAVNSGMSAENAAELLKEFEDDAYQKRLNRIEDKDPARAAMLDLRPQFPKLRRKGRDLGRDKSP